MTVVTKSMKSALARPSAAKAIVQALTDGKVARVQGNDGRQYVVLTSDALQYVQLKKK